MKKRYEISKEDAMLAQEYMKKHKDVKIYRRLQVIELAGQGKKRIEIAEITHFSKDHVSRIIAKFIHNGIESLIEDKRTGNNRKVTEWQEVKFLKSWRKRAERGEIVNVKKMWNDFQERYEVTLTLKAFYELLDRHGWRKIKPRKQHPKVASPKAIKRSKKLNVKPEN